MMDHGQKTAQPEAPAVEGRRDEKDYTQTILATLLLITAFVCMFRRRQEKW